MPSKRSLTENEFESESPVVLFDSPPSYELINTQLYRSLVVPVAQESPPIYTDLTIDIPFNESKLPSYEEIQNEGSSSTEIPHSSSLQYYDVINNKNDPLTFNGSTDQLFSRPLTFITIQTNADESLSGISENAVDKILGADYMFIAAFLIALIFNWLGFLMLTCFCQTIASRYGALSGFGMSLSKWSLIVKYTNMSYHENSWIWLLIMAFGLFICIRNLIQYINVKKMFCIFNNPQ